MIEKVQESHLYMWLKEKDSKFLSKLDETIEYANTILPQINNVFASYTVHGVRHSINVIYFSDFGQRSKKSYGYGQW